MTRGNSQWWVFSVVFAMVPLVLLDLVARMVVFISGPIDSVDSTAPLGSSGFLGIHSWIGFTDSSVSLVLIVVLLLLVLLFLSQ